MSRIQSMTGLMRVSAVAAMLVALGSPVYAQGKPTKTQIDLAREYFVIKGAHNIFEAVIPGVIEQGKNTLLAQNPALQKDLDEIAGQLRAEYAPRVNEVLTEVATVYASSFTEQELKDLLAFYKSPLGKKLTAQEPSVLERGMSLGQQWALKFSDEVMARMRVELKKKGHDL